MSDREGRTFHLIRLYQDDTCAVNCYFDASVSASTSLKQLVRLAKSASDSVSPRRLGSIPARSNHAAACTLLMPIFLRALLSILRRTEKAAFTTLKNSFSSQTSTGGTVRRLQTMTALSTLGAGIKDSGGTIKAISGSV